MPTRAACLVCLMVIALPLGAWAQQPAGPPPGPPPGLKTGNPTPGTPQPEPPSIADRITVRGCLQLVPGAGAAPASAATVPSDARYLVTGATKDGLVPPDTGTSSVAAAAAASSYRLEALESQLSPFVGARIEVSGEVKGTAEAPVLLLEFVRKLTAKCE